MQGEVGRRWKSCDGVEDFDMDIPFIGVVGFGGVYELRWIIL